MKVGLLAGPEINSFRLHTLDPILKDPAFSICLAVIDDRPPESLLRKVKKNIKRGRGGFILVMALQRLLARKEPSVSTESFCRERQIPVLRTQKPYAAETLDQIQSYAPEVMLLVGGFGIVRKPLLELCPKGVLSYHHGNMRTYRGMPPALWELYNGEREMGVTVQILSPGIDSGIPVVEQTIPIRPGEGLGQLEKRALKESEGMLYQALKKIADPGFNPQPLDSLGKVYTLPNLRQWIELQGRIWRRKFTSSL